MNETNPTPTQQGETLERVDQLLQRLVETPAGERIRIKCGAADLRSVITDILFSLGTITKPFPDPRHWQPVEENCEACDRGYRLAPDGLHYDDDRGGRTWGICRKVVAATASPAPAESDDEIAGAFNKHLAQRHEELATAMRETCTKVMDLIEQYTRPDFCIWLLMDHAGRESDPIKRATEAKELLQKLVDSKPSNRATTPPERTRVEGEPILKTGDDEADAIINAHYRLNKKYGHLTIPEIWQRLERLESATSDSARRAAEEIASWLFAYIFHPSRQGGISESQEAEIAAIISKHFAAAPADNDAGSFVLTVPEIEELIQGHESASIQLAQAGKDYDYHLRRLELLRGMLTTTKGDR